MALTDFQEQPGPPDQDKINYVREAFHLQYNWIALAGAGAFALISGSFLPIILTGGVELMYLAIVPQNIRFQRLVRSWKLAEEQKRHQEKLNEMLRSLTPEMQSRYIHSAQVCASIRANFAQFSSTSQIFLQQIDTRLQGLLNGYARLLLAAAQQKQYMKITDENDIKREIAGLQKALSTDSQKVQDINKKRLEKYDKICENQKVVDAQCAAVEDVLLLVRDQSVTMRDPQQVSERLDSLVHDVEQTEQTVQQVEAIFSDISPDMDGLMSLDDTSSSTSSASRARISN
jgi:hypothetical protein